MPENYFADTMSCRILTFVRHFLLICAIAFCSPLWGTSTDSLSAIIDSAFRFLNDGKEDSAFLTAIKVNPRTLPNPLQTHASRLGLAALHSQPSSRPWIEWNALFDPKIWSLEEKMDLSRQAFDAGLFPVGSMWMNYGEHETGARHAWEILKVRLAASQGHWKEAGERLDTWEDNTARRESSGEVLFWQGWLALHQHHVDAADTLFTLASAYVEESSAQRALEYRQALLIDSSQALYDYIRGLPESPLPDSLRSSSLAKVPESSPLNPYALWQSSLISRKAGDKNRELLLLQSVSKDISTLPGRKATARLAKLQFEPRFPDSAMAAYERLLLQYQQGVPPEFAKSRIQALRNGTPQKLIP